MKPKSPDQVQIPSTFEGFSRQTFRFFRQLEANNNREWFASHREAYTSFVAEPMKALARSLTPAMREIDGLFETRESRVLSRPHRDTRFSKDKSPYHTAAWLVYRRPGREWISAPAFFFEISANGIRYGMGFYSATPKTMRNVRAAIDGDPQSFRSIFSRIEKAKHLQVEGEAYARQFMNDHPAWFQTYYQKRNLYFMCKEKAAFLSEGQNSRLLQDFRILGPAYRYLMESAS